MRRFHLVCDDRRAREIEQLAREYGLTERAVIEQLVDIGLDEVRTNDGAMKASR